MGLSLNGSSQYLSAPWAPSTQPMTFMAWVRQSTNYNSAAIVAAANSSAELSFNTMQSRQSMCRAISFNNYAEAQSAAAIGTGGAHFLCAFFVRIFCAQFSLVQLCL